MLLDKGLRPETMHAALFLMPGWNEPETAPLGEEVTVTVLRPDGTALRELFGD